MKLFIGAIILGFILKRKNTDSVDYLVFIDSFMEKYRDDIKEYFNIDTLPPIICDTYSDSSIEASFTYNTEELKSCIKIFYKNIESHSKFTVVAKFKIIKLIIKYISRYSIFIKNPELLKSVSFENGSVVSISNKESYAIYDSMVKMFIRNNLDSFLAFSILY